MDTDGININSGAEIDTMYPFSNCIFRHGAEEGFLLSINTDLSGASDTLIIEDCRFDSVCSESLSNNVYRDSSSTGYIYFVSDTGGNFWGDNYDDDEGDEVIWNLKPIAFINFPNDSDICKVNYYISFRGDSSYDQDGSIVNYIWEFGDITADSGFFVCHSYEDTGRYTVNLTVIDDFSYNSSYSITLDILDYRLGSMTFTKISDLEMDGEQEVIVVKNHALTPDTSYLEIYKRVEPEILMAYDTLVCSYPLLGYTEFPAAIGDLDLDDTLDVVVATSKYLYCLEWHKSLDSFSNMPGSWPREYERADLKPRTPIICDFDYHNGGDKNPEILFIPTQYDAGYRIFILQHNGDTLYYTIDNRTKGPSSIADFNMDNTKEIAMINNSSYIYLFSSSLTVLCSLSTSTYINDESQIAPSIGDIDFNSDSNLIELELIIPRDGTKYSAYEINPSSLNIYEKWESVIDTTDTMDYGGAYCSPALGRNFGATGREYYDLWAFAGRTFKFVRLEPDSGIEHTRENTSWNWITQPSIGNMDSDSASEIFYGINWTSISTRSVDFNLGDESYSRAHPSAYKGVLSTPAIGDWEDDKVLDIHFPFVHGRYESYDSLMNDELWFEYDNYSIEWGQCYHDERNTSLYAQPVGGTLTTNAVWWGTYIIYKDFKIAQNCTLYIEPGTKIWVLPDSVDGEEIAILSDNLGDEPGLVDIVVEGTIEAHGKEHAQIVFTSLRPNPTYCDWGGIEFQVNGDKGYLEHTIIENADKGIYIKEYDVDLDIRNCEIHNCKLYGILSKKTGTGNTVTIDSTHIHHIDYIMWPNGGNCLKLSNSSNVEITNCIFDTSWFYCVHFDSSTNVEMNYNTINKEFSQALSAVLFDNSSSPGSGVDGEFSYNHILGKQCAYIMGASSPKIENCLLENPLSSTGSYLVYVSGFDNEPILRDDTLTGNYYIGVFTPASKPDLGEYVGDDNKPENCCIDDPDTLDDNGNNYFHYNDSLAYYVYVDVDSPACSGPDDPTARIPAEGNYWCEFYMPYPDTTYMVTPTIDVGWDEEGNPDGVFNDPSLCPELPRIITPKSPKPDKFRIDVYPTPFNNNLGVYITLTNKTEIKIGVYNIMGSFICELANNEYDPGQYKFVWDGKHFSGKESPTGI
ncbi:PKD domain-containing protein, partial [bacterium]|nr:PKD domain-containing protein [bacterium]